MKSRGAYLQQVVHEDATKIKKNGHDVLWTVRECGGMLGAC